MVGDGIRGSGHRAERGAGAGGCDIPQGLIKGECVEGKGAPTPRGGTQPALFAAQRGACTPDEGLCFHGWQEEWVWLLREMECHDGFMAFAFRPSLPPNGLLSQMFPPYYLCPQSVPLPCFLAGTSFN